MKEETVEFIRTNYKKGQRRFVDIAIEDGDLSNENLEGIIFDHCILAVRFHGTNLRNSKFTNGNIKTCDFEGADLSDAEFRNLAVESTNFKNTLTEGITFEDNGYYGHNLTQKDFIKFKEN
jgi:uncharacterized protein YjbI with pentapeptide repeats